MKQLLSNKQLALLARRMVDEICTRGHTRGTSEDLQGKVCLLGALGYAYTREAYGEHGSFRPITFLSVQPSPYEVAREHFSYWFVQFLIKNHPQTNCNADGSTLNLEMAPSWMAMWNDNILLTGEETIAWLNKFADAAEAAPVGAPVTEW